MSSAYVLRLHMWLYMHFVASGYMCDLYRGCNGKTAESKQRYESEVAYYKEAACEIMDTYLYIGTILRITLNQWLTPPTL